MNCADCRFFHAQQPGPGQCRRRAPALTLLLDHAWPKVYSGEWCGEYERKVDAAETTAMEARRDLTLRHLELGRRARNALNRDGIHTLEQLLQHSPADLLRIPDLGRVTLIEIIAALSKYDLHLSATDNITPAWMSA